MSFTLDIIRIKLDYDEGDTVQMILYLKEGSIDYGPNGRNFRAVWSGANITADDLNFKEYDNSVETMIYL